MTDELKITGPVERAFEWFFLIAFILLALFACLMTVITVLTHSYAHAIVFAAAAIISWRSAWKVARGQKWIGT